MAAGLLWGEAVQEDRLSPCYVFFGEEGYLAGQFIRRLKAALISPDAEGFNLEKFNLGETGWQDIIDVARTAPFFFSPWRIVVVNVPEETWADPSLQEKKRGLEQRLLKDYLLSPAPRTVLVVVVEGRVKKSHPVVRFFSALPKGSAVIEEMKRLWENQLLPWIDRQLAARGKSAALEAKQRLIEIIGNDLQRIDNELEKLATFAGDRRVIGIDDINQVCDWMKEFLRWDLTDNLGQRDLEKTLQSLNRLVKEENKPERILGFLANFFRDIVTARLWLKEGREKKEIFAALRPQIKENWSSYSERFKDFFSLQEEHSGAELAQVLRELGQIDVAIKTTDIRAQALFERFVIEYCRRGKRKRQSDVIWRGRR